MIATYAEVAVVLRVHYEQTKTSMPEESAWLAATTVRDTAVSLAGLFGRNDPGFDSDRFLRSAIGYVPIGPAPDRPRTTCGCGYELVWVNGTWEHDAAPSLWGNDHNPDAPDPDGDARDYWDRRET